MNAKLLIPLAILAAVIGGVVFFMATSNNPKDTVVEQQQDLGNAAGTIEEGNSQIVDASDNPVESSASKKYLTHTSGILDTTKDVRRVIFFYANWCPTCKTANEDFLANEAKIPQDVVVIRTNYNDTDTDQEEKDLAKKYGITYQHTFVYIDGNGNEISKWNGGGSTELIQKVN